MIKAPVADSGIKATKKKTKRSQHLAYKNSPAICSKPPSSSFPHFTLIVNFPPLAISCLGPHVCPCCSSHLVAHCLRLYPCIWSPRPSPSSLKSLSPRRSSVLKSESTPQDLELTVVRLHLILYIVTSLPVRGSFMSSTSCTPFGPGLWGRW